MSGQGAGPSIFSGARQWGVCGTQPWGMSGAGQEGVSGARQRGALFSCSLLFLLSFALAGPIAAAQESSVQDLQIQIRVDKSEVELGKAFPLFVERVWNRKLMPEEWSDRQLFPLTVRLEEVDRSDEGNHVRETRRFSCYAFSLEEIFLAAPFIRVRPGDGGPARVAFGEAITLRVKPALDPAAPGPVELPGSLLPEPPTYPWFPWFACGGLGLVFFLVWYLPHRARAAALAAQSQPAPPPHLLAFRRVSALRREGTDHDSPVDAAYIDTFHVEAAALMRDYIAQRFSVPVLERTTEEFLTAPATAHGLAPPHRNLLADFLARCDQVKFGRLLPGGPDREALLDSAVTFLEETREDLVREEPAREALAQEDPAWKDPARKDHTSPPDEERSPGERSSP